MVGRVVSTDAGHLTDIDSADYSTPLHSYMLCIAWTELEIRLSTTAIDCIRMVHLSTVSTSDALMLRCIVSIEPASACVELYCMISYYVRQGRYVKRGPSSSVRPLHTSHKNYLSDFRAKKFTRDVSVNEDALINVWQSPISGFCI